MLCCLYTHTDSHAEQSSAGFIIATDKSDTQPDVRHVSYMFFSFKRGMISQLIAHIAVEGLTNAGVQSAMRGAEENNSWRMVGVK